ncbi:hypothetical protein WN51_08645 [Melipona quadrifasciata]|uniref:Uncharacterized protein n=1 Tax=Melipona quadrifasciata TaxID=166423 RepID=A0A0M9A8Y0_9HYME|nr:hypothetical protein WN51_08645 [Melipona quadrifasciata]
MCGRTDGRRFLGKEKARESESLRFVSESLPRLISGADGSDSLPQTPVILLANFRGFEQKGRHKASKTLLNPSVKIENSDSIPQEITINTENIFKNEFGAYKKSKTNLRIQNFLVDSKLSIDIYFPTKSKIIEQRRATMSKKLISLYSVGRDNGGLREVSNGDKNCINALIQFLA